MLKKIVDFCLYFQVIIIPAVAVFLLAGIAMISGMVGYQQGKAFVAPEHKITLHLPRSAVSTDGHVALQLGEQIVLGPYQKVIIEIDIIENEL